MPLSVLIVLATCAPEIYGMERCILDTFDLLRPDVDPEILTSRSNLEIDSALIREIRARQLRCTFLSDWKGWPRVGKPRSLKHFLRLVRALLLGNFNVLSRALHNDVLYVPGSLYFSHSFAAAVYCRLAGKMVVYHFHDLITRRSRLLRVIAPFATDFVHNTELSRRVVLKANPFLEIRRNHVIHPPIGGREPARDDVVGLEGERNVVYVGQVAHHKGVDLLLSAFESISKEDGEVALHIVGGGADVGPAPPGVTYWGYRTDVLEILRKAYLHVLPTPPSRQSESFGLAVAEAMSFGVPTVCFRSGGPEELVVSGETGLICCYETAEALADHIRRFLNDPAFRDRCGRNAKKRFEEFYGVQAVRSNWLRLLMN
jgi:glycosyltransferase involved in cell wall biosynthesis